jgi:omega-hydroxy-beta-dihydromenaquinone-9 sulfotransferase
MTTRANKQPAVLPLGREAYSWVRLGGSPANSDWLRRALSRWQSQWFERNLSLQRMLSPEGPLRADPLFVLGLWRSGTTFLHDLLGGCPGLLSPTTSQCLNPASFRLRPAPAAEKSVKRPMDGLTIDTLSPQEDEFALLALGVPSVYRGFIDPRRLPELTQWLDPGSWSADKPAGWAALWMEFLRGVNEAGTGRLVLKSPGHTFRVSALPGIFPNAAHIWLTRDPIDTFLSNRKMWLAMTGRYALWDADPRVLDGFLAGAFEQAASCLRRAVALFPRDRLAVVHFEQLTRSTLRTLEGVNQRLSFGDWGGMQPYLARAVAGKEGYRAESYDRRGLPGEVVKAAEALDAAQAEAIASHGIGS